MYLIFLSSEHYFKPVGKFAINSSIEWLTNLYWASILQTLENIKLFGVDN